MGEKISKSFRPLELGSHALFESTSPTQATVAADPLICGGERMCGTYQMSTVSAVEIGLGVGFGEPNCGRKREERFKQPVIPVCCSSNRVNPVRLYGRFNQWCNDLLECRSTGCTVDWFSRHGRSPQGSDRRRCRLEELGQKPTKILGAFSPKLL